MEKPRINPCIGKQIELAVLVISRRELVHRRMGIRNSWAKDASKKMIIRYVIGGPSEGEENSEKLDKILDEEQEQFGDLIRYYNIMEGYHYLQFKICFLRCDRYRIIAKNCREYAISGAEFQKIQYVSEKEIPMEKYPEYMHGSTYFGNSKAITSIMKHTKEVFAIHIEDALYTGILAEKGNVSRYDHADKHFRNGDLDKDEPCKLGKPQIFCLYQKTFSSVAEYKKKYGELHNLKCE
uniref:Hexosyltransferase n=1 Tax=Meloidogyne javanica TaxID=6303 RepID=A0A915MBQ2_MELJA